MRWNLLAACTLASVTLLGCSLFNGQEGFLDRAAAKDTKAGLMIIKCTDDVRKQYCVPDDKSPKCRKYCG
jgi:hypothetical protein